LIEESKKVWDQRMVDGDDSHFKLGDIS